MDRVITLGRFRSQPGVLQRRKRKLQPRFVGDLTEVEEEIRLWSAKAAELWPTIIQFAFALRADAPQIVFKGDLIVFNAPAARDSDVGLLTLDLAAIRRIVCNLKTLQPQRKRLKAQKRVPIAINAQCSALGAHASCCSSVPST